MRTIFFGFFVVLLLAACKTDKPGDPTDSAGGDSLAAADSLPADSAAAEPPKAADGLFDDFIYSFMRNERFQRERIVFPLRNLTDGVDKPIESKNWRFDRMYSRQEAISVIFDSEASAKAEKDTTLRHVVVEWVYLDKRRVKQYLFDKTDGKWRLTALESHALDHNVNADFYDFYARFAKDEAFQKRHVRNPFHYRANGVYDDGFAPVEGLLDMEQWPDYSPALPRHVITNINYGQRYGNKRRRVLTLCSPSGGMACQLVFERTGKSWQLVRLEN